MMKLEQFYSEDDWVAFSMLFKTTPTYRPEPAVLLALKAIFPDESLAYVIGGVLGDASLAWVEREIPDLDGLRPLDCRGDIERERRLKTMLMRMDL
ncbi:hypothetical protein [Sphingobacterium suaedae]|uniref:DUF2384 domain-containing protein n=1 Tax=Sphingobacterium suaedae TaxID=1686402 RepID=A0ABW5KE97_9SPHI